MTPCADSAGEVETESGCFALGSSDYLAPSGARELSHTDHKHPTLALTSILRLAIALYILNYRCLQILQFLYDV
ncbi:hypothetical protein KC325_g146 [Hortaea werneckii]|nr:hypothetical protein KC325_g146 [Hortaea werneckii]